jgi:hypothetical protein
VLELAMTAPLPYRIPSVRLNCFYRFIGAYLHRLLCPDEAIVIRIKIRVNERNQKIYGKKRRNPADSMTICAIGEKGSGEMPRGRKRIIKTPKMLDELADAYFKKCKDSGEPILLTGLILALGLSCRDSLDEYGRREEFSDSVKRAKLHVEMEYEGRLHGVASTGAIFALKNFGWSDRQDIELTGKDGGPVDVKAQSAIDLSNLNDEELEAYAALSAKARGDTA